MSEMKKLHQEAWQDLHCLLREQSLAVLGTEGQGCPYTSLVAFAATADGKQLFFATHRETKKYRNLNDNGRVSLLIDNRENVEADFHRAMAVTVLGTARECDEGQCTELEALFLQKHPHLAGFVRAPTCALLQVDVEHYYLVRRFQNVLDLIP